MKRRLVAVALALVCALATTPASARHHKSKNHNSRQITCSTNEGRFVPCARGHVWADTSTHNVLSRSGGTVVGGRPAGCPHRFCGCEASRYVFGLIKPDLNLAYNWIRKFPRTSPAPGMAAARSGHVMILMSHVGGNDWLVHDGNSGGGLTREHVRSIRGYVIVDPHSSRSASR